MAEPNPFDLDTKGSDIRHALNRGELETARRLTERALNMLAAAPASLDVSAYFLDSVARGAAACGLPAEPIESRIPPAHILARMSPLEAAHFGLVSGIVRFLEKDYAGALDILKQVKSAAKTLHQDELATASDQLIGRMRAHA